MSTVTVTPLRQRMIEDMNARKLCAGTESGIFPLASGSLDFGSVPPNGRTGGCSSVPAAPVRDGHEHLQSQPHNDRATFLFRVTLRRLDLAAEILSPP